MENVINVFSVLLLFATKEISSYLTEKRKYSLLFFFYKSSSATIKVLLNFLPITIIWDMRDRKLLIYVKEILLLGSEQKKN